MLRVSLSNSRRIATGTSSPHLNAQWLRGQPVACYVVGYRVSSCSKLQTFTSHHLHAHKIIQRSFGNERKPDETIFPGSQSAKKNDEVLDKPPPLPSLTKPAPTTIVPPEGVPKTLPSAEDIEATVAADSQAPTAKSPSPLPSVASTAPSTGPARNSVSASTPPLPSPPQASELASPPNPPQPQIKRRKPRRFRRFILSLITLLGLSYAGGVYYSLVSDNFHDFFTEYIPYGEDAVGYFEEREFRRRFPARLPPPRLHAQLADEPKVTIASKSGMSVRPARSDDHSSHDISSLRGRHMSAIEEAENDVKLPKEARDKVAEVKKEVTEKTNDARTKLKSEATSAKDAAKDTAKKATGKVQEAGRKIVPGKANKEDDKKASQEGQPKKAAKAVEVVNTNTSPSVQAVPTIDHLKVKDAEEPAVQDLVKMLNDIITVINADKASGKYSSTISNAKDRLNKIIQEISMLKAAEKHVAEEEIKSMHQQFDNGAKELAARLEREMRDQEIRWKEEYESEREKLIHNYEDRLKAELEAAKRLHERQVQNALKEQQISQIRQFTQTVHDAVEQERGGRLSKLSELENSVHELEHITAQSSSVIDKTLQTQHLLVALDALTAKLDSATRPVPFLAELAAVREAANFANDTNTDTDTDTKPNISTTNLTDSAASDTYNSTSDPVILAALSAIPPHLYNTGIPTYADLRSRFRTVASQVRKAALLPDNAGIASHAVAWLMSNFMARKQGSPDGEDVESVLARADDWLARGDLENAAREVNSLKGWSKRLASDWLEEVRKVCAVRMAVDVRFIYPFYFFLSG